MSTDALLAHPDMVGAALLFCIAAASGVSLYASLAALGLASRLNLMPPLPPGLTGLENGLVITTACALLVIEALADREAPFAGMWHTLHALVKPVAAALLSASALAGLDAGRIAAACVLASATALLFHAMRYGARVALRMPNAPRGSALVTFAEALLALGLLLPARFREAAVPVAAALLLVALIGGPLGFRAFRLGVGAQRARLRGFLGQTGWSSLDRLPRSLRGAVPPTPLGGTPPRAARIGVLDAPGIGRFSLGWLVSDSAGHQVLASTWRGTRAVRIEGTPAVELEGGTWADELGIGAPAEKLRILLLKDGPAPALALRALAPEPVSGARVDL